MPSVGILSAAPGQIIADQSAAIDTSGRIVLMMLVVFISPEIDNILSLYGFPTKDTFLRHMIKIAFLMINLLLEFNEFIFYIFVTISASRNKFALITFLAIIFPFMGIELFINQRDCAFTTKKMIGVEIFIIDRDIFGIGNFSFAEIADNFLFGASGSPDC